MEPLWSLVVATGGNRSQIGTPRNREIKPKPLPWVATACREQRPLDPNACTSTTVCTLATIDAYRGGTAQRVVDNDQPEQAARPAATDSHADRRG
jgi:hypothetical protein